MSRREFSPGEIAPRSGQYELIGPRGGQTGEERTVVRGEPLPPTPEPGMGYLVLGFINQALSSPQILLASF